LVCASGKRVIDFIPLNGKWRKIRKLTKIYIYLIVGMRARDLGK
jgi:hypothetical protein